MADQGQLGTLAVDHGLPYLSAHRPDLSANPSPEGPLNLQLADVPVELGDLDVLGLFLRLLARAKSPGRSLYQRFSPGVYLTRVHFEPAG